MNKDIIVKKSTENLKQRAYLNGVTSGLDFFSKEVVGFILNPIMVSTLGPLFYGILKILGQMNSYMATADLNVSQTLKVFIMRHRADSSEYDLKKVLSTSIWSTIIFLPIYILAGSIIIWFAPVVVKVDSQYNLLVRSTSALLITAFILNQFFSNFEAILRGMNLAYKRMGMRSIITFLGGALNATALFLGYGIIGIACVQIFVVIITGLTIIWIVKFNVSWFGFVKIKIYDTYNFIKLSGWFMSDRLTRLAADSSDILILGFFTTPQIVASYVISKFLMNVSSGVNNQILTSVTPGFGKLIAEKQIKRLLSVRVQLINLIWLLGTTIGSVVCIWNNSFISIWTKPEYFIGQYENLLIVFVGLQFSIQQVDSSLINISLNIKKKIPINLISISILIVLSWFCIPTYRELGLLLALFISKLQTTYGYARIIGDQTATKNLFRNMLLSRINFVAIIVLLLSAYLGNIIYYPYWSSIILGVGITLLCVSAILWFIGLGGSERAALSELRSKIRIFSKKD